VLAGEAMLPNDWLPNCLPEARAMLHSSEKMSCKLESIESR
jgi:hypothetical protein